MNNQENLNSDTISAQTLTRIEVCGFKSLSSEIGIAIRPLTILAGANSSGKSSIMQPLLLMKQTLESTFDPGVFLFNGPNIKFSSVDEFLSKIGDEQSKEFSVKFSIGENYFLKSRFAKKETFGMELVELEYNEFSPTFHFNIDNKDNPLKVEGDIDKAHRSSKNFISYERIQNRCFLLLKANFSDPLTYSTYNLFYDIEQIISGTAHLPGLRGNPERGYPVTAVGKRFQGVFQEYTASIIHFWQTQNSPKLQCLNEDLRLLRLTTTVEAKRKSDIHIEIIVGRLSHSNNKNNMVSIADVGVGVSQTLPVLVALQVAVPGQIVYIEQPEIHLHPRAQVGMAQILVNAANRGVQVIIETHSSLLLLAIQTLVAENKIDPTKIALHWFSRQEDGSTKVDSADLDNSGAFGDWPEDFADVELETQNQYLNAAELKIFGGA